MTNAMMNLRSLVEKSADADLLRDMIGFAAEKLMELEVGAKTAADYAERNGLPMAQRRATATETGENTDRTDQCADCLCVLNIEFCS